MGPLAHLPVPVLLTRLSGAPPPGCVLERTTWVTPRAGKLGGEWALSGGPEGNTLRLLYAGAWEASITLVGQL